MWHSAVFVLMTCLSRTDNALQIAVRDTMLTGRPENAKVTLPFTLIILMKNESLFVSLVWVGRLVYYCNIGKVSQTLPLKCSSYLNVYSLSILMSFNITYMPEFYFTVYLNITIAVSVMV